MRFLIPILILIASSYLTTNSFAQVFRNYTVSDGLPTNEIYECFQDKDGIIWFGTSLGVSRYDGYEFKNLTTLDGLPDNTIFGFFEDSKGRIWFRSFNGLIAYSFNNRIVNISVPKEIRQNHITGIYEKDENSILIQYIGGSVLSVTFDMNQKPLVTHKCKCDITVSNLIGQKNSILTKNCADYYNFEQHQGVRQYRNYGTAQVLVDHNKVFISFDGFKTHRDFQLNDDVNGAIYRSSKNGHLFIPTIDGFIEFSGIDFENISRRISSLGQCSSVTEDNQGGIWVTSTDKGVYYFPNQDVKITLLQDNISDIEFCNNALYLAVNETKIVQLENGLFQEILKINDNPRILKSFDDHLLISEKKTHVINSIQNILDSKERILCFYNNSYWGASSNGGLIEYDDSFNKLNAHVSQKSSGESIRRIFPNKGHLFIVRLNGVERFDLITKEFEAIDLNSNNSTVAIADIQFLMNGWEIYCTLGEGIILRKGNTKKQILKKDGLPSNIIFNATRYRENTLWLSSPEGVSKIHFNNAQNDLSFSIQNFTKYDGLSSNFINDIAVYHDSIFIATNNGLNIIPSNFKVRTHAPIFSIHSIEINGVALKVGSQTFDHFENNLTLTYGAIHFPSEGNITYKYRLLGISDQWIATNEKKLQFFNLNPGTYTLEIYAISADGKTVSEKEKIDFQIAPPFYQEFWFISILIVFFLVVIWTIVKYRLKLIRKKLTLKYELERLKGIALRSQLNPHFIFNALNSIQNYIANNNSKDSLRYLAKFSRLIRIILETSDKELYTLEEEFDFIRLYLEVEKMRFTDKLNYEIEIDKTLRVNEIAVPPFILQPYVENAIWHGIQQKTEPGKVTVKALKNGKDILIQVIDDGVGLPNDGDRAVIKNDSKGLSLSAERLENHTLLKKENITVTVQNNIDQGVTVTILIKGQ